MYEIKRFPYDANDRLFEPAWLWERYLERQYVERAIRIKTDDQGLEFLELNGRPSERTVKRRARLDGRDGVTRTRGRHPAALHGLHSYGAGDPAERVALLDQEHLESALLYPTIHCCGSARSPTRVSHSATAAPTTAGSPTSVATACADRAPDAARSRRISCRVEACRRRWLQRRVGGAVHAHAQATAIRNMIRSGARPWTRRADCDPPDVRRAGHFLLRFDKLGRPGEFHYNVTLRQGVQALPHLPRCARSTASPTLRLGILEWAWAGLVRSRPAPTRR